MSDRRVHTGWVIRKEKDGSWVYWTVCNTWVSEIPDAFIFTSKPYAVKIAGGVMEEVVRVENLKVVEEGENGV